jgi:hypothetical protein
LSDWSSSLRIPAPRWCSAALRWKIASPRWTDCNSSLEVSKLFQGLAIILIDPHQLMFQFFDPAPRGPRRSGAAGVPLVIDRGGCGSAPRKPSTANPLSGGITGFDDQIDVLVAAVGFDAQSTFMNRLLFLVRRARRRAESSAMRNPSRAISDNPRVEFARAGFEVFSRAAMDVHDLAGRIHNDAGGGVFFEQHSCSTAAARDGWFPVRRRSRDPLRRSCKVCFLIFLTPVGNSTSGTDDAAPFSDKCCIPCSGT